MKTLEQLVKELGLTASNGEILLGRSKSSNGYSIVQIDDKNRYWTLYPSKYYKIDNKNYFKVRGWK